MNLPSTLLIIVASSCGISSQNIRGGPSLPRIPSRFTFRNEVKPQGHQDSGVVCPSQMQPCRDGTCIPERWFCDREEDCAFGEDETKQFCPSNPFETPVDSTPPPLQLPHASSFCREGRFYCDGYCVPTSYRCNGQKDCAGGIDEANCLTSPLPFGESGFQRERDSGFQRERDSGFQRERDSGFQRGRDSGPVSFRKSCEDNEEQCFDGKCISVYQLCNGLQDCDGGEDEFGCSSTVPKAAAFRCMESCFGVIRPPCQSSLKIPPTTTTTTTPAPRPTKRVCPTNMVLVYDRCIYVHVVPPLKWREADTWAVDHEISLVEIDSGNFFVHLLKHLNTSALDSYSYWVGANDLNEEGDWRWTTSKEPVYLGTPLWSIASNGVTYVQQPGGGTEENCALLENCPFNYLNDFDCEEARGFIAQHEGQLQFV